MLLGWLLATSLAVAQAPPADPHERTPLEGPRATLGFPLGGTPGRTHVIPQAFSLQSLVEIGLT
jgi:hypothetical protein